ncbi:MAG: aminopeptidase P family protein [Gemmatimonadaceae bacterium]|nr:aminopeptidase P family protein [Gemmatimonadaceae bacterium]NUQ91538.1 aminopeptidase P family protein [Gemmatimonadaceae bacterium]NUR18354.1 aminopeptidase P family protein [Gemmatimonadaceae bacterium]NUS97842.1 aminopeptidase P family protein [Gemmatimonadaceae bacterium]
MLDSRSLATIQRAVAGAGLDGWLLYDFRGNNPIASSVIGLAGMVTRRIFVFVPREGTPVAITHAIEQVPWASWPREWEKHVYSSWRSLEETLRRVVAGKRVAMEYSPGDAVPYVDYVPAGVLEMVRAAGAEVVTSGEIVSRVHAVWTDAERAAHERAAEAIARIAREAFTRMGKAARSSSPLTEHDVAEWIRGEFRREGLETDHGPNVSVGANAANPHYEPSAERSATVRVGDVVLIDLWAREPEKDGKGPGVYADQTWMGVVGEPSARALAVWTAIRDARDAAIAALRERLGSGETVRGGEIDDASRAVIVARGFGDQFTHRTGHSIDVRGLHGSGPHIDNLETREERALVPGVGFSIEPGVYLSGELGMRTEVNGYVAPDGRTLVITPREIQRDLIVV